MNQSMQILTVCKGGTMDELKELNDSTLWLLLADIGMITTSRSQNSTDIMKANNTWLSIASKIRKELDKRMSLDFDK